MRYLGEQLAARGFTRRRPAPAPATATTRRGPRARRRGATGSTRVERCARRAARARADRVAVVGQSLGGLLALAPRAPAHPTLAAVASLAAPLWLDGARRRVVAHGPRRGDAGARGIPKLGGSDIRDRAMQAPSQPVLRARSRRARSRSSSSFMRVVARELAARPRAGARRCTRDHDHTAPVACAREHRRAPAPRDDAAHACSTQLSPDHASTSSATSSPREVGDFFAPRRRGA